MKAIVQREFGGPEVLLLEEVEAPEPIPTEVQVRVRAAGVNPVDFKTRSGRGMAGVLGDRLKVRVAAPPEAGKANAAVLALLAGALDRKDLRLVAGAASAEKTVLLPGCTGLTPDQLAELA